MCRMSPTMFPVLIRTERCTASGQRSISRGFRPRSSSGPFASHGLVVSSKATSVSGEECEVLADSGRAHHLPLRRDVRTPYPVSSWPPRAGSAVPSRMARLANTHARRPKSNGEHDTKPHTAAVIDFALDFDPTVGLMLHCVPTPASLQSPMSGSHNGQ